MPRRVCVFCQQEATLTGEHLWSNWLNREPSKGYTFRYTDHTGTVTHEWQSKKLNIKVRVVCPNCNSGWMSGLEQKAKSILENIIWRNTTTTFGPRDIVSIASFAFTKTVVADAMAEDKKPFFSPRIRHRFSRSLAVPEAVQVWLAAFHSRTHKSRGIFKSLYHRVDRRLHFHSFTFGMGDIILQVASPRPLPPPGINRLLRQNAFWTECTAELWPSNGRPIPWPPGKYLSDDTVDAFVNRWGNLAFTRPTRHIFSLTNSNRL